MPNLDDARTILAKCLFVQPDAIGETDLIMDIKPIDSLTFQTIILEIEEKTGQDVTPEQVLKIETVSDLAALISGSDSS